MRVSRLWGQSGRGHVVVVALWMCCYCCVAGDLVGRGSYCGVWSYVSLSLSVSCVSGSRVRVVVVVAESSEQMEESEEGE